MKMKAAAISHRKPGSHSRFVKYRVAPGQCRCPHFIQNRFIASASTRARVADVTGKPTLITWLLLLSLGVLWGFSFLAVELALPGFAPLQIAALRIAIAAVIVTAASFALRDRLPPFNSPTGRRIWLHCFGMAIFSNALPFSLLSWAQLNVNSGFAGISMAVVPLMVLPLAHIFVPGEHLNRRKLTGFLMGFAGVVILIGPAKILAGTGTSLESIARLACVLASCSYACGAITTRTAPKGPALAFSAAALILASLIMLPLAFTLNPFPTAPQTDAILAILYLAVFPTALAIMMLVHIIKTAGPSFLSLVNYQVPIWAVLFGMVFLNEALPASFLAALGLILLGMAISQGRRKLRGALPDG